MEYLTRDSILAVNDLILKDIEISEWGGKIKVRVLSGGQRAKFLNYVRNSKDNIPEDFMERLIIAACCDEKGVSLFKAEDIKKLSEKNSKVLEQIFEVAAEMNGLSEEGREKIKGE